MKYFKIHIELNKVRCLTIGQFEAAEATIAENGSLFYVMNVTETKRKESCLTLTCRRKQQVQKFISEIRPSLIGDEKESYVFGQKGGEKMVSIVLSHRLNSS